MNTNAMFKLSYGLFVLTTKLQGKDNGCIVNTVQQIADKPLRIAVAVNKAIILTTCSSKAEFSMLQY